MKLTFLGTNGSCGFNNKNRLKYGTSTLCVVVSAGNETLIFDSGAGIHGISAIPEHQREHFHLFFSHYHTDHISGFLFFPCLFDPDKKIDIYGSAVDFASVKDVITRFLSPPFAPVGLETIQAKLDFHTIEAGIMMSLPNGTKIETHSLSHPGGTLGYRVEYEGKTFCYLTDVELGKHQDDDSLLAFMHAADLLIMDSVYDDGQTITGFGHSSWRECADWAGRAGAKQLALYHYGFKQSDADIDEMEKKAKKVFPDTFATRDGMQVEL